MTSYEVCNGCLWYDEPPCCSLPTALIRFHVGKADRSSCNMYIDEDDIVKMYEIWVNYNE